MTEQGFLRPMRPEDLAEVMEIDRKSLSRPWSEAVWREELASRFGLYRVREEDGIVCGYVGLKHVADEAHVMSLAVRPQYRRRGFARTLVEAALEEVIAAGARNIYLEVRPSNREARALYSSLGFVQSGVRPRYYGDEDALLMTLKV